jgi:hypothetical protein
MCRQVGLPFLLPSVRRQDELSFPRLICLPDATFPVLCSDFTFVCPTEILAFNDRAAEFAKLNCEVIGASVDSEYTHLAWVRFDVHLVFFIFLLFLIKFGRASQTHFYSRHCDLYLNMFLADAESSGAFHVFGVVLPLGDRGSFLRALSRECASNHKIPHLIPIFLRNYTFYTLMLCICCSQS